MAIGDPELPTRAERVRGVARLNARRVARGLRHGPADLADALSGRGDDLIPPRRLQFVGVGDFAGLGETMRAQLVELCDLSRTDDVLDIGCGIGRLAVPLTRWLAPQARYEGFDIVPEGIAWCRRHIGSRHPNFGFQLADLYNSRYNPRGHQSAAQYRFPYEDDAFDVAWAYSVFTHMLPAQVGRYLSELARVLRPGGRVLITAFVLDAESRAAIAAGVAVFGFKTVEGGFATIRPSEPEAGVAFDHALLERLTADAGLVARRPMLPGYWRGGESARLQDVLVVTPS